MLELKNFVIDNPKYILWIHPVFNLLIPASFMTSTVKEANSPLTNITKSFVNLNFSKENPDQKNEKKKIVEKYIDSLLEGEVMGEIISTYHTPALKLSEPSDSWGFMINNIQPEQMVLSSVDSFKLFKRLNK